MIEGLGYRRDGKCAVLFCFNAQFAIFAQLRIQNYELRITGGMRNQ